MSEPSRVEALRNTQFLCNIGRTTRDESRCWVSARPVALFLFVLSKNLYICDDKTSNRMTNRLIYL